MKAFRFVIVSSALLVLGLASASARAESVTVGTGGITTIQQAVVQVLGNADADDKILIPKGNYPEQVTIDYSSAPAQKSLILQRVGKGQVLIQGQGTGPALKISNASHVKVRNLFLFSGNVADGIAALRIDGTSADIDVKKVKGMAGDDVGAVVVGASVIGVRFDSCDFSGILSIGFQIDGFGHELRNCHADDCGFNGIVLTTQALDCSIIGCSAILQGGSNMGQPGVITVRGNGHVVRNTVASGGGMNGFYVVGAGHSIESCEANGNAGAGFFLDDSQSVLKGCKAANDNIGVLGGGLGATISGGSFKKNAGDGINLTEGGTNVLGVSSKLNGGNGINVTAMVLGTSIKDSVLKANMLEGVLVSGQLAWLEGNLAKDGDGFIDAGTNNAGRDNVTKGGGTNDF